MITKKVITNTDAKELLSSLLKSILDKKLSKLEDNNSKEILSLSMLNQNSKELLNILNELSPNPNTLKENRKQAEDLQEENINKNEELIKNNYLTSTAFYKPKILMKKNLKLSLNNSYQRSKLIKNRESINTSESSFNQMLNNKTTKHDTNNKPKKITVNTSYNSPFNNTSRLINVKKVLISKFIPTQKSPVNLYSTNNILKNDEKIPQKNLITSHSYLDINKIKKVKKIIDKKINVSQILIKNNNNDNKKKVTAKLNKNRGSTPLLVEKKSHVKNQKSNLTTIAKNNNKNRARLSNASNSIIINSELRDKIKNEKIKNNDPYKTSENFYPIKIHKKDVYKELESICKNFEHDQRIIDLSFDELIDVDNNNKKVNNINEDKGLKLLCDSLLTTVNQDELLVKNNSKKCFISEIDEENFKIKKVSLYEKLETCLEYFKDFLTTQDLFELGKINKEFFHLIINLFIRNAENCIEEINNIIKQIPLSSHFMIIKPFEFNTNSSRAISLLNSISKNNIFKIDDENFLDKNILLVFELFFIAIGKKSDIYKLRDNPKKEWEFICKFFNDDKTDPIGNLIVKEIKGRKFDEETICTLYEYSHKLVNIIKPNYYKKINKDIAILVFIIKNILEHVGISNEISIGNSTNKTCLNKLFILHNSRLIIKKKVLNKLNHLLNN